MLCGNWMYDCTLVARPVQQQELEKLQVRKKVFKQCRKKLVGDWKEYEIHHKNDVPAKR